MPLTVAELAYTAGMLDGEGSIMLIKTGKDANRPNSGYYVHLTVKIVNTNREVIDWINQRWESSEKAIYTRKPRGNFRQMYGWQINGKNAYNFILDVYPYLIIKKKQADIAIAFIEEGDAWLKQYNRKAWSKRRIPIALQHFKEACLWSIRDLNNAKFLNGDKVLWHISEMERTERVRICR